MCFYLFFKKLPIGTKYKIYIDGIYTTHGQKYRQMTKTQSMYFLNAINEIDISNNIVIFYLSKEQKELENQNINLNIIKCNYSIKTNMNTISEIQIENESLLFI